MNNGNDDKSDFSLNFNDDIFTLELYSKYRGMAIGLARQYGISEAASEDVAQRVVLASIEKRDYIKALTTQELDTYMLILIKKEIRSMISKRRKSKKKAEPRAEETEEIIDIPMDALIYDAMKKTLLELPEKQREILQYKYILRMDCIEIAESMGISDSSVRKYLSRARRKLMINAEKVNRKRAKNKDLANEKPQEYI